jgi:hypothetical protein
MRRLLLLLTTMTASACSPMLVTVRHDHTGMVVDGGTKQPVAGASVVVESWQVPTPPGYSRGRKLTSSFETKTDAAGQWQVPAESKWMMGIIFPDGSPFFLDTFCVTAPGYAAFATNPWAGEPTAGPPNGNALSEARPSQKVALRRSPESPPAARSQGPTEFSRCGIPMRTEYP